MNNTATPTERHLLTELLTIARDARGDAPALAEVRKLTALEIDRFCEVLASSGVDTVALLNEIDDELDG